MEINRDGTEIDHLPFPCSFFLFKWGEYTEPAQDQSPFAFASCCSVI